MAGVHRPPPAVAFGVAGGLARSGGERLAHRGERYENPALGFQMGDGIGFGLRRQPALRNAESPCRLADRNQIIVIHERTVRSWSGMTAFV